MEKKAKQGIMWYSADLASFLFKCAWKTLFLGFRAEILLLCAEILPLLRFVQKYYWPGTRGSLDSRAGPFLGSVKKYWFFGEIFTSGPGGRGVTSCGMALASGSKLWNPVILNLMPIAHLMHTNPYSCHHFHLNACIFSENYIQLLC